MKKLISALLTVVMVVCVIASVPVSASTETLSGELTYTDKYGVWSYKITDSGKLIITGYDQSKNSIEIPSYIGGIPVVEIGHQAFWNCENLTNITIPNTVTAIGEYAFVGCTGLSNITIPENVATIGECAFVVGEKFTDIYVSDKNNNFSSVDGILFDETETKLICYPVGRTYEEYTIPNNVAEIGNTAFACSMSLSKITIPDTIVTIGDGAFMHCQNLKSITIPENVAYIGISAFFDCSSLETATIFSRGSYINYNTFSDCVNLTNVKIGDGVTAIDRNAFSGCTSLSSIIIPNSVSSIGYYAFSNCTSLTDVTISDSVVEIGNYAFNGCSSLTHITIPNSIKAIKSRTFNDCINLTSITIPKSITEISADSFGNCNNLKNIYYTGNKSEWDNLVIGANNECLTNATVVINYVEQLMGDVSCNGQISIVDVIYLLKYIIGDMELNEKQIARADLNGDSKLTVVDVLMIQNIIISM